MTIETSELTTSEKRKAGLAKAREAKKQKAEAALESPSRVMDNDEVRAKRARLLNELASLPDDPTAFDPGAIPGTTIKDGLGEDKIPWTPARIRAACDRNETIGGSTFTWKTVLGDGKIISVAWNGIVYWLWPDRENKIPSVHHNVYMQALEDRRREASRWRSPATPGVGQLDGFNSAEAHASEIGSASNLGHIMGVGPLEPRGE